MLVKEVRHDFLYGRVYVFVSGLEDPRNSFSPEQEQQGFAYRDGSVSFLTPFDTATCLVSVFLEMTNKPPSEGATRVIEVPFLVSNGNGVRIASTIDGIDDEIVCDIKDGLYLLRFEAFHDGDFYECEQEQLLNFLFIVNENPSFCIRKADSSITIPDSFITIAKGILADD